MSYLWALTASLAILLVCAPPVGAAGKSSGLYVPFPEAPSPQQARRFIEHLPRGAGELRGRLRMSERELEEGVFSKGGHPIPSARSLRAGAATARALGGEGTGPSAPAVGVLLAVAVALGASSTLRRRRS